jgi:selenocysteine lyase/cysteine desulfurase
MLAFSGHKGLMGPQGTGCLYIREGIELTPLKFGGTGSHSEYEIQPEFSPDKYESGTQNIIGIAGLGAAVDFVLSQGVENIRRREIGITEYLLEKLSEMDHIIVYGYREIDQRTSVVSFNLRGHDSSEIGDILDKEYDIAIRCGLHCSPIAHKTIGTFPDGTVRIGLGFFNTEDEIDYLVEALSKLSK